MRILLMLFGAALGSAFALLLGALGAMVLNVINPEATRYLGAHGLPIGAGGELPYAVAIAFLFFAGGFAGGARLGVAVAEANARRPRDRFGRFPD